MQVGFIGTGSMGRILIEAFIEANALLPSQVYASNRTFEKVKELAKTYTGLHAYPANTRVVQKADLLFLCVKPLEFKTVIDEIVPYVRDEQMIVSITSPVEIKDLEKQLTAKIAKIIPSITNSVRGGASLMVAGSRLSERDKDLLFHLMQSISQPLWIDERFTRVSSDIVSCGPAILSYLAQRMIDAAVRETGIPKRQATLLMNYMLSGFGDLLSTHKFTLETLQERVCVPGGVTGEALKVLEEEIGDMFASMFRQTHRKFEEDVHEVYETFYSR